MWNISQIFIWDFSFLFFILTVTHKSQHKTQQVSDLKFRSYELEMEMHKLTKITAFNIFFNV